MPDSFPSTDVLRAGAPPESVAPASVDEWLRAAPLVPGTLSRLYLAVEFAVLFVGLPVLLFTQRHALDGLIAPTLILLAVGCTGLLWTDRFFDRRQLWNPGVFRRHVARTLRWFVPGAGLVAIGTAALRPDLLMTFPQAYPGVWVVLMVTYPVVSVYPQEIIFRAFLFHRYHAIFPSTRSKIVVSSLAFGIAHIVFANWAAPVMTTISGVLFARTYVKTQSTLQVTLEHGLWGCFAFTVGLGWYVYSGAIG